MSQSAFNIDSAKILVLSGAYPQPGWGVLVEYKSPPEFFERLIESAIEALAKKRSGIREALRTFTETSACLTRLRDLDSKPSAPDFRSINQQLERVDKARAMFADAGDLGDPKARQRMATPLRELGAEQWLMLPNGLTDRILDALEISATAKVVKSISRDIFSREITTQLAAWQNGIVSKEEILKTQSDRTLKQALVGCLRLIEKKIVPVQPDFYEWAESAGIQSAEELRSSLKDLNEQLREKVKSRRAEYAQLESDHTEALKKWRDQSRIAREEFHEKFQRATELQLSLGSQFLVALQDACGGRIWARSIPWDPARMVGWKLFIRGTKVSARDLDIASRELIGNNANNLPPVAKATDIADGSYFTDYVHYVAFACPPLPPRAVATKFLARLLLPSKIISLLKRERQEPSQKCDAHKLADDLIAAFGWRAIDGIRNKSLAACVRIDEEGKARLGDGLNGNDLRIVVESLCKDILDVLVAILGYDESAIWAAISEREPRYDPDFASWFETVAHVTAGEAAFLLRALGPLAFPERKHAVDNFVGELQIVSKFLNTQSHHQEIPAFTGENLNAVAEPIQRLLTSALAVVGELPWHMQVSFVYGEQPKVLSGEAWSHGSASPRLLKVIVFDGQLPEREPLLWNGNRRNPVITDPKFIKRPGGRHGQ